MATLINPIGIKLGLASIIVITAPTGSTVTLTTPNGTIKTTTESSGTWTFNNLTEIGTYTINASLGTKSATKTLLIDAVGNYSISIEYSRLPSIYQEVEYIASDSNQWIDTGYIGRARIILKFYLYSKTNYVSLCGSLNSSSPWYRNYATIGTISNATQLGFGAGAYYVSNYASHWTLNTWFEIDANFISTSSHWYKVDGTTLSLSTQSFEGSPSAIYNSSVTLGLMANNTPSGVSSGGAMNGRVSVAKLYDSTNTLIRDFVPCYRISDSVIGMYDIVNDVFYTNAGSGSFTKGDDV